MKTDSVTLIISVPVHQQMKTWTRARKHTKSFTYIINLHTTPPKKKWKNWLRIQADKHDINTRQIAKKLCCR
jgi:hypothetical protein